MELNVLIVDDVQEEIAHAKRALSIAKTLPELADIALIPKIFTDPKEVEKSKIKFHFALIDVDMPELNGFELAKKLNQVQPSCLIIFLTNHDELATEGFLVRTHRYLIKPIEQEKFEEATLSAVMKFKSFGYIQVVDDFKERILDLNDILYFQTNEKGSQVFTTKDRKFECTLSLSELEKRFPEGLFFRINKDLLIHMKYYVAVNRTDRLVLLECGDVTKELLISYAKLKKLKIARHSYYQLRGAY